MSCIPNLLCLLWLIATTQTELTFVNPALERQFGHSKIKHFMAPVGLLPYGRNRTFELLPLNNTDCESLKIPIGQTDSDSKLAILVDSNNCNFSQLAKKAENVGAGILLISNNKNLNFTELNNSAKDPANANLRIPVIVVSDETAQKLRNLTVNASTAVLLSFKVEIQKSDSAKLAFNFKMDDSALFELFEDFVEVRAKLGDLFQLTFALFKREKTDEEFARIQMILNCVDQLTALRLLQLFRQFCFNQSDPFTCFMDSIKKLEEVGQDKATACSRNKEYLKMQPKMNILTDFSNSFSLINQSMYVGPFRVDNLVQAICGAFLATPDACVLSEENYSINGDESAWGGSASHVLVTGLVFQIVALIFALCCFFMCLSVLFRKVYHRFLQRNYKEIVGKSMNTYQSVTIREESQN